MKSLALVLAAAVPAAQAACPPPPQAGSALAASGVQVAWRSEPASIAVGQPFAVLVTVCPATAQLVRVDATMPEHRHGMNYKPTLKSLGDGLWRAEGLLWHMAGRWELRLDVLSGTERQTLRQSVTLP